jgi:hypothetical protein
MLKMQLITPTVSRDCCSFVILLQVHVTIVTKELLCASHVFLLADQSSSIEHQRLSHDLHKCIAKLP